MHLKPMNPLLKIKKPYDKSRGVSQVYYAYVKTLQMQII